MMTRLPTSAVMVIIFIIGSVGLVAKPNESLVNALVGAFTPSQMSALIDTANGRSGSDADQTTRSLVTRLEHLVGTSSDVALALLRFLGQPEIPREQLAEALAQGIIQYHAVNGRLLEMT